MYLSDTACRDCAKVCCTCESHRSTIQLWFLFVMFSFFFKHIRFYNICSFVRSIIQLCISLSLSLYIYIYIYIHTHIIYIYIYIYTDTHTHIYIYTYVYRDMLHPRALQSPIGSQSEVGPPTCLCRHHQCQVHPVHDGAYYYYYYYYYYYDYDHDYDYDYDYDNDNDNDNDYYYYYYHY